jgi:hypothetical protein
MTCQDLNDLFRDVATGIVTTHLSEIAGSKRISHHLSGTGRSSSLR